MGEVRREQLSDDIVLYCGDCLEVMAEMEAGSIDSVITDPPYGLQFMGKEWDRGVPGISFWEQALRVSKPGAMLLSFGGDRTHHRLMCAIEDAGWEIRTCVYYIFGSGFPKSLAIDKSIKKSLPAESLCSCESHYSQTVQDSQCDCQSLSHSCDEQLPLGEVSDQAHVPLSDGVPSHNHDDLNMDGRALEQPNTCVDVDTYLHANADFPHHVLRQSLSSQEYGNTQYDMQENTSPALHLEKHKMDYDRLNTQHLEHDSVSSSVPPLKHSNIPYCTTCGKIKASYWGGYGTALKPAAEIIAVAMKPIEGTYAENALTWGVAGLWIDGGRVGTEDAAYFVTNKEPTNADGQVYGWAKYEALHKRGGGNEKGRWPANLIHDGSDEVVSLFPETKSGEVKLGHSRNVNSPFVSGNGMQLTGYGDSGSAARFFYCAKASRAERNAGLELPMTNIHETVKPVAIMEYLAKLTKTPTGGVVLDPFMGSGTTGIACVKTGRPFIGIELDEDYFEIAKRRILHAMKQMRLEI